MRHVTDGEGAEAGSAATGGSSIPVGRGGNGASTGVCNDASRVLCTERDCTSCEYEGATHPVDASFRAKDGCNSCSCNERGEVTCTHQACETNLVCGTYQSTYLREVDAQKLCTGSASCVVLERDSLPCGCEVAVSDRTRLDALAAAYYAEGCGKNAICPPCPVKGLLPYCVEGSCVLAGSL